MSAKTRFPSFILMVLLLAIPAFAQQEPEKEGAGIIISGKASSSDVGLPLYPGSTSPKDESSDSQAARLGLWGGGSGFRLAVVKMDSVDSPERVAAF
jgi:hypothetical protein